MLYFVHWPNLDLVLVDPLLELYRLDHHWLLMMDCPNVCFSGCDHLTTITPRHPGASSDQNFMVTQVTSVRNPQVALSYWICSGKIFPSSVWISSEMRSEWNNIQLWIKQDCQDWFTCYRVTLSCWTSKVPARDILNTWDQERIGKVGRTATWKSSLLPYTWFEI